MDGLAAKVKKTAKDTAKEAAKQAVRVAKEETQEFAKSTKEQAIGDLPESGPSLYEELVASGNDDNIKKEDVEKVDIQKLQQIEGELAELRAQRRKEQQEWKKDQEALIQKGISKEPEEFIAPPESPQKGPSGPGKKNTKGTGEMVKSKK